VIGVMGDMRRQGPEREPIPQAFRPYAQAPSRNMILVVRADRLDPALVDAVRTRVAEIDGTVPVYRITTLSQALDRYHASRRVQAFLLALFSAVALILAAGGIYGVVQQSVARRTPEIGVRMALGAVSIRIMLMVLRQGLAIAVPGIALGIVCALWVADVLSDLFFGVAAQDPATIAVTTGVLLLTAAAASYIPARRAARVSPMAALQSR
jgi:putative ABC transport system permease protein